MEYIGSLLGVDILLLIPLLFITVFTRLVVTETVVFLIGERYGNSASLPVAHVLSVFAIARLCTFTLLSRTISGEDKCLGA